MVKIAIFLSGRLNEYTVGLLPLINNLKKKYDIRLFASINSFSLDKNDNIQNIQNNLKRDFGETLGTIHFEYYKMPKTYVQNLINNNITHFRYNQLSCFYNDENNFRLIDNYEKNNNYEFDIICKLRSEIVFDNNNIDFIQDNKNDLIIRNKHMQDIRHWGHVYKNTPLMVSDAFAYGNKKSMKFYCSTYQWILKNDLLLKGTYLQTFEIFLTDSILQFIFYHAPGGGEIPLLTANEIINKYVNNPNKIRLFYFDNLNYRLLPIHIRSKNNFVVNETNCLNYTQQ